MRKAEFTPALYTRNTIVDNQHKELIDAVNNLYAAIEGGKGKEEAIKTLDFLASYTVFHFGGEEKLYESHKYPLLDEHKKLHADFVEVVRGMQEKLIKEGPNEAFAALVEKEITNWLVVHIKGADMKAIEWINSASSEQRHNML